MGISDSPPLASMKAMSFQFNDEPKSKRSPIKRSGPRPFLRKGTRNAYTVIPGNSAPANAVVKAINPVKPIFRAPITENHYQANHVDTYHQNVNNSSHRFHDGHIDDLSNHEDDEDVFDQSKRFDDSMKKSIFEDDEEIGDEPAIAVASLKHTRLAAIKHQVGIRTIAKQANDRARQHQLRSYSVNTPSDLYDIENLEPSDDLWDAQPTSNPTIGNNNKSNNNTQMQRFRNNQSSKQANTYHNHENENSHNTNNSHRASNRPVMVKVGGAPPGSRTATNSRTNMNSVADNTSNKQFDHPDIRERMRLLDAEMERFRIETAEAARLREERQRELMETRRERVKMQNELAREREDLHEKVEQERRRLNAEKKRLNADHSRHRNNLQQQNKLNEDLQALQDKCDQQQLDFKDKESRYKANISRLQKQVEQLQNQVQDLQEELSLAGRLGIHQMGNFHPNNPPPSTLTNNILPPSNSSRSGAPLLLPQGGAAVNGGSTTSTHNINNQNLLMNRASTASPSVANPRQPNSFVPPATRSRAPPAAPEENLGYPTSSSTQRAPPAIAQKRSFFNNNTLQNLNNTQNKAKSDLLDYPDPAADFLHIDARGGMFDDGESIEFEEKTKAGGQGRAGTVRQLKAETNLSSSSLHGESDKEEAMVEALRAFDFESPLHDLEARLRRREFAVEDEDVTEKRTTTTYVDGRKEIRLSNGLVKLHWTDGTSAVLFQNGDKKVVDPDGKVTYSYKETQAIQVTLPPPAHPPHDGPCPRTRSGICWSLLGDLPCNGSVNLYKFVNGQIERHLSSNVKWIVFANGLVRKLQPPSI